MSSRAPLALTGILSAGALAFAACGGGGASAPAAPTATRAAPAPTATRAATTAAPAAPGGDVNRGRALLTSQGCGACHTIAGLAGAVGQVGPALTATQKEPAIGTRAATRKPGLTAAQYIEESIREPDAYTVEGFQKGLMPKLPVTDAQVKDLVAFLLTLR